LSDDDYDENDPLSVVATKILDMMSGGFEGCTPEEHVARADEHDREDPGNHYNLSATYQTDEDTQVWDHNREFGIDANTLPTPKAMPRGVYPGAATLAELFEGVRGDTKKRICLHTETADQCAAIVKYDTDSWISIFQSLAALRLGLRYTAVKAYSKNIRTNVHIKVPISYVDTDGKARHKGVHLKDIPHLFIGQVKGFPDCDVCIFFPRLYDPSKEFTFLPDDVVELFTNSVLNPALACNVDRDVAQYVLKSYRLSQTNAKARKMESAADPTKATPAQQVSFTIRGQYLSGVEDTMRILVEGDHQLACFGASFLVANAKGFKLTGKNYSIPQAFDDFDDMVNRAFDWDLIDAGQTWVDIGEEICPNPSTGFDPQVFLYKTCCLQRQYQRLKDTLLNDLQGGAAFYHPGFIRDAAALTLEVPKSSEMGRNGVTYFQWYPSVKTVFDAQRCHPFANTNLDQLALDKRVWSASARDARVTHAVTREGLISNYNSTRERIRLACDDKDCEVLSCGTRFEARITWAVRQRVRLLSRRRLRTMLPRTPTTLSVKPEHLWAVKSRSYFDFYRGNFDKFISGFELPILTSPVAGVYLEQTRLMVAFMKCLRTLTTGRLDFENALALDVRGSGHETRRGLGMASTLEEYGYAWFNPVVDWDTFSFRPEVAGQMYIMGDRLMRWYSKGQFMIQDADSTLHTCADLLAQQANGQSIREEILQLMVHLCLRAYRYDVLTSLRGELRGDIDVFDPDIKLCYQWVQEAFVTSPWLGKGNKSEFSTLPDIMRFLYGKEGSTKKSGKPMERNFLNASFRVLNDKARDILKRFPDLLDIWDETRDREFFKYHWLIPYPEPTAGLLINKGKDKRGRMWYSIIRPKPGTSQKGKKRGDTRYLSYDWGRDAWDKGSPQDYPATLFMTDDQLRDHVRLLRTDKHAAELARSARERGDVRAEKRFQSQ
jgi:hypothetical protein